MEGLLTMKHSNETSSSDCENHVMYVTSASVKNNNDKATTNAGIDDGIPLHHLSPNDTAAFDATMFSQQSQPLDMAIFDRFFTEEQFSHAIYRRFPHAAMILDMQDIHALRRGRQQIVQQYDDKERDAADPFASIPSALSHVPPLTESNLLRELSSIHRCDLTLVCSPYEMDLLRHHYGVPEEKLCLASFFVDTEKLPYNNHHPPIPDFSIPPRFVFCGGFKHDPNVDAVRVLLDHVWPRIRSDLPHATLHIYGAHCPISQLQANYSSCNPHGIFVHGYEERLEAVFGPRKGPSILLAPLRFGAGIKGKIVDAWTFGMPVVTTPIGSEGMTTKEEEKDDYIFGGAVASTLDDFCHAAIVLATSSVDYFDAQQKGRAILQELFSASQNWKVVEQRLQQLLGSLETRRQRDSTQAILWHSSNRSTEYFSRWIELKENIDKK
jgi:O-antigen biosynthesis protein